MQTSHVHGRAGEEVAAAFLAACGYRIVERRWRMPGGELDLVTRRDGWLVFVEVKTRGPRATAVETAWVGHRQRRTLRRAARSWLAAHPEVRYRNCRFDVVAVSWRGDGAGCSLRHLPGAF
ncbi:MAG: YraN family protein [bacterium]|nr:YraN family protein [bacterium]